MERSHDAEPLRWPWQHALVLLALQIGCSLCHLAWMAAGAPVWLLGDTLSHLDLAWRAGLEDPRSWPDLARGLLFGGGYPRLVHAVAGGLQLLLGDSYWAPWLVIQGSCLLMGCAAYGLASRFGPSAALFAGCLTLLSPGLLMEGKRFQLDAPSGALLMLGYAAWAESGGGRRWWGAALGSVAFCLAVAAKYQALLLLAPAVAALWSGARERPLPGRLLALCGLGLPLGFATWTVSRALPSLVEPLGVNTSGGHDYAFMLLQFASMTYHALLGPALALCLAPAAIHHARRGRWGELGFAAAVVLIFCSFSTVKARHVLGLLPLLTAWIAGYLWETRRGPRRGWAALALLALCAWPWWPPAQLYTVSIRDADLVVPSDREFGMPSLAHTRLGFSPNLTWSGWAALFEERQWWSARWYFPPENCPGSPVPWGLTWRPMRLRVDPVVAREFQGRLPEVLPPNRHLTGVNLEERPPRPSR